MKNGHSQEHGAEVWYKNDQLHREDGPACIEPDGTQSWYLCGLLHRIGGPALIRSDGTEEWWLNGVRHREDGPAVEGSDGTREWHIRGSRVSEEEFNTLHCPPLHSPKAIQKSENEVKEKIVTIRNKYFG